MEQQVPTVNLPSPIPSHYSVVSDSSPLVVQDPSALNVSPNQQQVMSPNSTTTATLMQATRLDIPVQVLEQFAQASVLDASILEDLRSAVVELHDRMQYRTNVLGIAATSLNTGYNQLPEHVERTLQSVEAHTRALQTSSRRIRVYAVS